jgi:hypothetical protein
MTTNWFSRVFGRGGAHADRGAAHADAASPVNLPTDSTIVDSDELASELARARRYEHDLAIVVLSALPARVASGDATEVGSPDSKLPQMVALMTAVALREALRHSDVVCYQAAENRFVLALTESGANDAWHALERIRLHFRSRLSLQILAGVAAFPGDAFTLDELVAAAARRATHEGRALAVRGNGHRNGRRGAGRRADVTAARRERA